MTKLACITAAAAQCGRPNLADAWDHAHARAAALGVRQRVVIQRIDYGAGTRGVYYRIETTGPREES